MTPKVQIIVNNVRKTLRRRGYKEALLKKVAIDIAHKITAMSMEKQEPFLKQYAAAKGNKKVDFLLNYFKVFLTEKEVIPSSEKVNENTIVLRMPSVYNKFRFFCQKNDLNEKVIVTKLFEDFLKKNEKKKVNLDF